MTDYYANWKARLAGQTVKTFLQPQLEDAGYYRLPITNRKPNGQTDITGWVPVAMWVEGEEMTGLVGALDEMREMTSTQLCGEQFWSWICRHPITYEVYDTVANKGAPWPDSPAEQLANTLPETVPAAGREVNLNHNAAPEEDKRPAHEIAAEKIDNARGVADTFEVKDLKTAEQALGIVNRLDELRLKAKRDGEAEYKPLYNQYKTLLDAWSPPIARADASAKALTAKINSWKRAEEKRLAAEAAKAEADRKAAEAKAELERKRIEQEELERAARAADRAIAEGIPPTEHDAPTLELEPPITLQGALKTSLSNPPTTVALAPTYGKRKLRDTPPELIVTITDYDAVYEHFKNMQSVKDLLFVLAKASLKINVPVPGATGKTEE